MIVIAQKIIDPLTVVYPSTSTTIPRCVGLRIYRYGPHKKYGFLPSCFACREVYCAHKISTAPSTKHTTAMVGAYGSATSNPSNVSAKSPTILPIK